MNKKDFDKYMPSPIILTGPRIFDPHPYLKKGKPKFPNKKIYKGGGKWRYD